MRANMLVVTTENVPNHHVQAVIGEVVGVTARTFNPFIQGVKALNGRLNPQLVRLPRSRQTASASTSAARSARRSEAW